jgi:tRNA1Val (adenine37-N6)-methyltransferase
MGRNNYFQFKKFRIIQEQAAMKVGTDGVLLGAWADTSSAKTILDVGTGTGLIALMMAQRSDALITGIEIESMASAEALRNAFNSPWKERIILINSSLQEFVKREHQLFDLIVSNPPFFINSQKSKYELQAIARHNHLLPLSDFITCCLLLLNPQGKVSVILPVDSAEILIRLAENNNLFLYRKTEVKPKPAGKSHRYLLEFSKTRGEEVHTDVLAIHNDDGSNFTEEYKNLTREFYLNF